jgi:AcrR family transcriptional regulator
MSERQAEQQGLRQRERKDSLENRALILAVAKRLFADQGVDATSMGEIGRAAGIGKGTLYRHFAHKGALCRALIAEDVDAFEERLAPLLGGPEAPSSAVERLNLLIAEKIYLTERHLSMFAAIDEAAAGPRRTEMYSGQFPTWLRERLVALLAEATDSGAIAPLDVEYTADTILAVTSPALLYHQRRNLGYSLDRVVAGAASLLKARLIDGGSVLAGWKCDHSRYQVDD